MHVASAFLRAISTISMPEDGQKEPNQYWPGKTQIGKPYKEAWLLTSFCKCFSWWSELPENFIPDPVRAD